MGFVSHKEDDEERRDEGIQYREDDELKKDIWVYKLGLERYLEPTSRKV